MKCYRCKTNIAMFYWIGEGERYCPECHVIKQREVRSRIEIDMADNNINKSFIAEEKEQQCYKKNEDDRCIEI